MKSVVTVLFRYILQDTLLQKLNSKNSHVIRLFETTYRATMLYFLDNICK